MRRIVIGLSVGFCCYGVFTSVPAADPPAPATLTLEAVLGKDTVVVKDIAFGNEEKQKLDLYCPKGAQGLPVVMYVHGGEWMKGDKAEVSYKPKLFNDNGIVFVSVNYRLSPAAKHPAHVSDLAAAVRWLVDNVAQHGGDPKKIVLMGHSAGSHLVVLTTIDPKYLAAVKLKPKDVSGVVAWSGGSFDLIHKAKSDEKFFGYIGDAFGSDEKVWREASPVYLTKGVKDCPPYLFVTPDPTGDSFKIAETLAKQIVEDGGKATTQILKDRTHKTANHLVGAPDDTTSTYLLDFVRTMTTKPK